MGEVDPVGLWVRVNVKLGEEDEVPTCEELRVNVCEVVYVVLGDCERDCDLVVEYS